MTDFIPDSPPVSQTPLPEPNPPHKITPWGKIAPWLVTLVLHGLIFAGAYGLYKRAVQGNQSLTPAKPAVLSATAITPQKEVLVTLSDSTTPVAINQEAYAPSPKVRADLPVLTTADIIAQGNAIRAAQEGDKADSAVSATALTALSATTRTAISSTVKTTTLMLDASDEALTDRDIPAKDRKNGTKTTTPDPLTADINPKNKADKKGTASHPKGKTEKTDQAKQSSQEADKLTKSLDETTAELSKNIDIVKNKNRQKIAKEFNTKPTTTKADDSLHDEDIPAKK